MDINELDKLIEFIYNNFGLINKNWENNKKYKKINMRKYMVSDIIEDNELLDIIYEYRNYVLNLYNGLLNGIASLNLNNKVEVRVKAYSSVQDKVNRYNEEKKHEYGKIPINKCINDILGFRIIFNKDIDFIKTIDYINNKYTDLKCINSSKNGYIAIHVYFTKNDNYKFRWELQLWNSKDVENNKECHERYKQEYTKFENENEEDDKNV